jgi:hypothetical protein
VRQSASGVGFPDGQWAWLASDLAAGDREGHAGGDGDKEKEPVGGEKLLREELGRCPLELGIVTIGLGHFFFTSRRSLADFLLKDQRRGRECERKLGERGIGPTYKLFHPKVGQKGQSEQRKPTISHEWKGLF